MKRLTGILSLMCLLSFIGRAQEVRLGVAGGTNMYENTKLDTLSFSPLNSYYTYLEEESGAGLINKHSAFNSIHFGAVLNFSYKRFGFNIEPQFFYSRKVYRFKEPYELSRVIGQKAFRMPTYFTYKFFKKENSSYAIVGLNFIKASYWDFQNPGAGYYLGDQQLYEESADFGDDHFNGVLYDEKGYKTAVLGLGKQFKKMNASLRYMLPLGMKDRVLAESYKVELTLSWMFLSTADFTKKHFLYIE